MKRVSPTNDFVAFAVVVLISLIVLLSLVDPGVEALMSLSPQQRHSTRLCSTACTTPPQTILATKRKTHQRTSTRKKAAATATATAAATADIGVATIAALSGTKMTLTDNTIGTEKHVHYDYDDDLIAVGRCVRNIVRSAACHSIQERGRFCVAIDGCFTESNGSSNSAVMSDMLKGTSDRGGAYWTSKTTLLNARHPCCSTAAVSVTNKKSNGHTREIKLYDDEDDNSKSILHNQQETLQLLRNEWVGTKATLPSLLPGDAVVQAADYVKKLRSLPTKVLPRMSNSGRAATDIPVLDLIILMISDDEDGILHYLTTTEDENTNKKKKGRKKKKKKHVPWVVPVGNNSNKKGNLSSNSVTLSLPVLNAAKRVLVVVTETAAANDETRSKIRNWKSTLQRAIPKATWIFVRDSAKKTSPLGQSSCTTSAQTNIGSTLFTSSMNSYLDSLTASSTIKAVQSSTEKETVSSMATARVLQHQ